MTVLASVLNVTNAANSDYRIEVGGTINAGEFAVVNTSFLSLGNNGPGLYNLTNGTLTVGTGYIGGSFTGQFNHFAGSNSVSLLRVLGLGEYDLYDGSLSGPVELYFGGLFKQTGGTFNGSLRMDGTYELQGGFFTGAEMDVPPTGQDHGEVIQSGGTNQITGLALGAVGSDGYHTIVGGGYYTLSNGVLVTEGIALNPGGKMTQAGGIVANHGPITIGHEVSITYDYDAPGGLYELRNGLLLTDSIEIHNAFTQADGTNQVAGEITITKTGQEWAAYNLSGGWLTASKISVGGQFYQSGGTNLVSALSVTNPNVSYFFGAGKLVVSNLNLAGGAFHHTGGTVVHRGVLTIGGGLWDEQTAGQEFGPLQLVSGGTAILSLPTNFCVIHFSDSSSLPWSARLSITNWSGSTNGGGMHQVIFGSNYFSLTGDQLGQVIFDHPTGLTSGGSPPNCSPPARSYLIRGHPSHPCSPCQAARAAAR